jgi:hypothetical protein
MADWKLAQMFYTDRDEGAAKADGEPPAVGEPRGRLPGDSL